MTANVENARLLPYAVIQKAADGNVDSFHRTGFGKSTIGLISGWESSVRSAFPNAVLSVERDGQAYLHSHAATPVSGERFGPPKSMLS